MSDSNCNINDQGANPASLDPREAFEFIEGPNISILTTKTSTKTQVTIGYKDYAAPQIDVTPNIAIAKVGATLPLVTFSGSIIQGSENIVNRSMVPDKGLDLTSPFTWDEVNVTSNVPGLFPQFSGEPTKISVLDEDGITTEKDIGVDFRHLTYMGFSDKDTLTEAEIKALFTQDLLSSVKEKYASFVYNYSVVPVYIYWVYPVDIPGFTYATEGILPVPLKLDLPAINVTDEGVTKSYRVIRTAVKAKHINANIKLQ